MCHSELRMLGVKNHHKATTTALYSLVYTTAKHYINSMEILVELIRNISFVLLT